MSDQSDGDFDAIIMEEEWTFEESDIENVLDFQAEEEFFTEDAFDGEVCSNNDIGKQDQGTEFEKSESECQDFINEQLVKDANEKIAVEKDGLQLEFTTNEPDDFVTGEMIGDYEDTEDGRLECVGGDAFVSDKVIKGANSGNGETESAQLEGTSNKYVDMIIEKDLQESSDYTTWEIQASEFKYTGNKHLVEESEVFVKFDQPDYFESKECSENTELEECDINVTACHSDQAKLEGFGSNTKQEDNIHNKSQSGAYLSSQDDPIQEKQEQKVLTEDLEADFDNRNSLSECFYNQSTDDDDKGETEQGNSPEWIDNQPGEKVQMEGYEAHASQEGLSEETAGSSGVTQSLLENKYFEKYHDTPKDEKASDESNKYMNQTVEYLLVEESQGSGSVNDGDFTAIQGHITTESLTQICPDGGASLVTEESDLEHLCDHNIDRIVQSDTVDFFQNMEAGNLAKNVNNSDEIMKLAHSSTHLPQKSTCGGRSAVKTTDSTSDKKYLESDKSEQVVDNKEEVVGRDLPVEGETLQNKKEEESEVHVLTADTQEKLQKHCMFEDLGNTEEEDLGFISRQRKAAKDLSNPGYPTTTPSVDRRSDKKFAKDSYRNKRNQGIESWSFGSEPVLVADIIAHRLSQSLTYEDTEELSFSDEDTESGDDSIFEEDCTLKNEDNPSELKAEKDFGSSNNRSEGSEHKSEGSCNISLHQGEKGSDNSVRSGIDDRLGDVIKGDLHETGDTSTPSIIESGQLESAVQGKSGHFDIPDDNREENITQLSEAPTAGRTIIKGKGHFSGLNRSELCCETEEQWKSEKSLQCGKRVSCSPPEIQKTCIINDRPEAAEGFISEKTAENPGPSGVVVEKFAQRARKPEEVNKHQWGESNSESYKVEKQQEEQLRSSSNYKESSVCFEGNLDWTSSTAKDGIFHQVRDSEQQSVGIEQQQPGISSVYTKYNTSIGRDTHSVGQSLCHDNKSEGKSHDNKNKSTPAIVKRIGENILVQDFDTISDKIKQIDQLHEQYSDSESSIELPQSDNQGSEGQQYHITMERKGKQSQPSRRKNTDSSSSSNKQKESWNMSYAEDEDFEVIDYEDGDVALPRVRQGTALSTESLPAEGQEECHDGSMAAIKTIEAVPRDDEGFEIVNFDPALQTGSSKSYEKLPSSTLAIHHDQRRPEFASSEGLSPRSKYLETNLDSEYCGTSKTGFGKKITKSVRMDEAIHNKAISGAKVGVKKMADSGKSSKFKTDRKHLMRDFSDKGKSGGTDKEDFDSDISEARQLISEIYGDAFKSRKACGGVDVRKSTESVSETLTGYNTKDAAGDDLDQSRSVEFISKSDIKENLFRSEPLTSPEIVREKGRIELQTSGNEAGSEESQRMPFVVEQYTIGHSFIHTTPEAGEVVAVEDIEVEENLTEIEHKGEGHGMDTMDTSFVQPRESNEHVTLDEYDTIKRKQEMTSDFLLKNPKETILMTSEKDLEAKNVGFSSGDVLFKAPQISPLKDSTLNCKEIDIMSSESVLKSSNIDSNCGRISNKTCEISLLKDNKLSSGEYTVASVTKQEERQQRGRTRERRTVRDVKEAVRKLKGEKSCNKERPHSYHGDEAEEVRSRSSSRRRYDWNTTHFFPDIHDDEIRPLDKRSDRASQYSLYLEEDWLRDQYYSQQEQAGDKLSELNQPEVDYTGGDSHSRLTMDTSQTYFDKENRPPGEQSVHYTTPPPPQLPDTAPPGDYRRNKVMDISSSQEELEQVNPREPVTTESSSSDPGDRESPKVWKKSPLHVNKKKRKDRPLSQEVKLNGVNDIDPPAGAIPISRMGVKMGSPGSRLEQSNKNVRGNKRPNAPNMGTKVTPKRGNVTGSSATGTENIQQKYAKFEELQKRRRALESTSEESLVTLKAEGNKNIQDSLRRYNKHRHPRHPDKTNASRKLFQSQEAIYEKTSQDTSKSTPNVNNPSGSVRHNSEEKSRFSHHSSSNEENTNDFLIEMKKKLRSVRKSQEDLRYEKGQRGEEVEGKATEIIVNNIQTKGVPKGATMSPYKTSSVPVSHSTSLKSQLDHISTENVAQSCLTDTRFHQDAISQQSIPERRRILSSSFENIYDGMNPATKSSHPPQTRMDENTQLTNGERDHRPHGTKTDSPMRFMNDRNYEMEFGMAANPNNPHFQNGVADVSSSPQHQQVLREASSNPSGSQQSLDGSMYGGKTYGERRSSGDSRTTPTSQTSEGQRKLDAKSLMMEERKKFEVYKREYVRRMSSKESTSGDETRDSCGGREHSPDNLHLYRPTCVTTAPVTGSPPTSDSTRPHHIGLSHVQRPDIPPDEYDYILRKIHHTRQNATVLEKSERAQRVQEANAALAESERPTKGQTTEPVNQARTTDSLWSDSESYLQQQKQKLQRRQQEAQQLQREGVERREQPSEQPTSAAGNSHTKQYVDVARQFSFNEDDTERQETSNNKRNYKEKTGHHLYSKSMSAIDSDAVFDHRDNYYRDYRGKQEAKSSKERQEFDSRDYRGKREAQSSKERKEFDSRQSEEMTRSAETHQQKQMWYRDGHYVGQADYEQGAYGTHPKNGQDRYNSMPKSVPKESFPRGDYNRHSYHEGFDNNRRTGKQKPSKYEQQYRQEDYISKAKQSITADFSVPANPNLPRDDYYSYKRKPGPQYYEKEYRDATKYQYPATHQSRGTGDAYYQSYDRLPQQSGDIKPYHESKSKKKHAQNKKHDSLPDFRHRKDLLKSWSESHIDDHWGGDKKHHQRDQYNIKPEKYRDSARDYLPYPDQSLPGANLEYPTTQREASITQGNPRHGNLEYPTTQKGSGEYPRQRDNKYGQANDGYQQHSPSQARGRQYERPRYEDQYYRDGYSNQQVPYNQPYDHPQQQDTQPYDRPHQQDTQPYDRPHQQDTQPFDRPHQQDTQPYDRPHQQDTRPYDRPHQQDTQPYDRPQQQDTQPFDRPQQQDPYYTGDAAYSPPDTTQRPTPQGMGNQYNHEQRRNQAPPKPARYQQQQYPPPPPAELTSSSHSNPMYDHIHGNLQTYPQPPSNKPASYPQTGPSDQQPTYQYAKIPMNQQPSQPIYGQSGDDRVDQLKERIFQVAYSPNNSSPRQGGNNFVDGERDRYVREYVPVEGIEDANVNVGPNASVHTDSYFKPVNPNASFSQYSDATVSVTSQLTQPNQQYYPPANQQVNEDGMKPSMNENGYPTRFLEEERTKSVGNQNAHQPQYGNQPNEAYYQYPTPPAGLSDVEKLDQETFSASKEHRRNTKPVAYAEQDRNVQPMKSSETLPQPMVEEDRYTEVFPPPPPPIEEIVDFPQQDQETFTRELDDKLRFLKETDPRFRDYEDKVSQYIREHKSQASNQYEAHIQQERDSYRAQHQAQLPDRDVYVDIKTIQQRKEGFEELHQKKLLRSRSLPRESGNRGREFSPARKEGTGRVGRGRDGRRDRSTDQLEKQESVFERKAKFTQSFRQSPEKRISPDKATEKKSQDTTTKKISVPMTRHVLRPSRSAENLHAASEDMPKISVLDIKERLFGPTDHKPRSEPAKPELGKVLERKDRKVDVVKDVFSQKEEKVPVFSTSYKSKTGVIDVEKDELLYNIVSYRDKERNINIFDDLTDLEITYERLKRENGEDSSHRERYGDASQRSTRDYDPTEPNVKRLSISNVRKFEELLQRRQDSSPKEEYTKQWIKKEKTEGSVDGSDKIRQPSLKKHQSATSVDDSISITTSEDRRFSGRLSLPRKKADDMAYRKSHQVPSANSVTVQSMNLVAQYLPQPGKSSSVERVTTKETSVPRNRASRSPEKEPKVEISWSARKNRDRISMKEARNSFISGDLKSKDQDSGRLRSRDMEISIRKRAKSLDRNTVGKEECKPKSSLERSNSFGRGTDPKNLSKGVATMVKLFTSAKEMSQSAPDLTKNPSVFAGDYNIDGDLVSEDPKYNQYAKPKKLPSSTPRMVKMRNEMKSKMKVMKTSGDSGFYQEDESDSYSSSDQFHRLPPDGAFCDSDEFDLAKVSDGSLEKDHGKGLYNIRAKFEVQQGSTAAKRSTENNNANNNNNCHGQSKTPPSPTLKSEMKVKLTPPSVRKVNISAETKKAKENFMSMDQPKPNPVRPSHIDLSNITLRKVAPVENDSSSRDKGSPYAAQFSQLQYIDDVIASTLSTSSPDHLNDGQKVRISSKGSEDIRPKFEFKREMLRKKDASPDHTSKITLVRPKIMKPKYAPFGVSEELHAPKQDQPVCSVPQKLTPNEIVHGGLKAPNMDDIGSQFDEELQVARAKLSGKISPSVMSEVDKKNEVNSKEKDTQSSTFEIQFSKPTASRDSKAIISQISKTSTSSLTSQDSPRNVASQDSPRIVTTQDSPRIINISLSRNSSREGDVSQTESEMSPNVKINRIPVEKKNSDERPQFSWSDSKTNVKVTPKPSGESRFKETHEARGFKEERDNYSKEVSQVRIVRQKTSIHKEVVKEPSRFDSHHPMSSMVPDNSKFGILPVSLKDLSDGEMTDATDITLDSMVRANMPTSYDPFSGFNQPKREVDASSVSSENSQKEYLISEGIQRRPHTVTFGNAEQPSHSSASPQVDSETSSSTVSHKRSSKSESSITTETSQSGTKTVQKEVQSSSQSHYKREVKKELRDERRLSLKERVQLFEEQAEPFMRKSKTHDNA